MAPRKRTPIEQKAVPLMVRLPPDLHEWVKEQAEKELRSLNAQVIVLLQRARDTTTGAHGD
jgi:hypothetical protein